MPQRQPFLLVLPLIIALPALADTLTTQASCSANGQTLNNPNTCTLQNLPSYSSRATAQGAVQGGVTASVDASTTAETIAGPGTFLAISAGANVQITQTFNTSGPLTTGFILLDAELENYLTTGVINFSISDGQHTYEFFCLQGPQPCPITETEPFNLGTTFTVVDDVTAASIGLPGFDVAQQVSADLTFTVETGNGTAVASNLGTASAPEPATSISVLLSLTALALSYRRNGAPTSPAQPPASYHHAAWLRR